MSITRLVTWIMAVVGIAFWATVLQGQSDPLVVYPLVRDKVLGPASANPNNLTTTSIQITGNFQQEKQINFYELYEPDKIFPPDKIDVELVRLPAGSRTIWYQLEDLLKVRPAATVVELAARIPVVRTVVTLSRTEPIAKTYIEGKQRLAIRINGSQRTTLHGETYRLIMSDLGKEVDVTFIDDAYDPEVVGWMAELARMTDRLIRK